MFKVSLDKQESKKREDFPVHVTKDSTYKGLSKILLIVIFFKDPKHNQYHYVSVLHYL